MLFAPGRETDVIMANPVSSTAAPLLSVRNVSVRFGGIVALDGVTFDVFPGQIENKPFNAFSDAKRELEQRCKVENWTLHDLRRTAASTMASLQILPIVIEKILNHKIPGVAGIYNRHTYADEMRTAVAAYEAHIAKLIEA